eukprot:6743933-Prymnesium_polylepis.1
MRSAAFAGCCAADKQPDAASLLQQLHSHMLSVWAAPAAPSHRLEAHRCGPPQRSAPSQMAAPVGARAEAQSCR